MAKPSLKDLYLAHRGKVSDKWDAYFGTYERAFADHRERPVALLEVGVQNGGSLELWARYFEAATILVGCDADQRRATLQFADPRIHVVAADANSDAACNDIRSLSPGFDVIIDKGSHCSPDIIKSLLLYFPLLRPGGIYIVEDLRTTYRQDGLHGPRSAMTFLKALADLINVEFWRKDAPATALLAPVLPAEAQPAFFADGSIESIEFSNSMAVLRRAPHPHGLGKAVIVGDIALITPSLIEVRARQDAGRIMRPL